MHKQGFPAVAALLVAAGCVTGPNEAARGEADLRSAAIVLYVHPGGDDANPGTVDAPFATVERARDALRKLRRNGQESAGPRVVQLHGGTYRLTRPLVLTPQDSGTADAPVVYQAAPGERVVISGGRKVTGWLRHDDRLWVAEAPWSGEREQPLTQLFVNNRRRTRARTPNPGTYFYTKHLKRDSGHGGLCRGMTFVQGDIERWPGFEDNARIVLYHNWVNSVNAIGEVDWDRRRIRFHRPAGVFFLGPNVRYYVENVRAALDAPGEWFFDHAAGKLYYYPKPDEDLVDAEVVVSVVPRTLISVQGDQSLGLYV